MTDTPSRNAQIYTSLLFLVHVSSTTFLSVCHPYVSCDLLEEERRASEVKEEGGGGYRIHIFIRQMTAK